MQSFAAELFPVTTEVKKNAVNNTGKGPGKSFGVFENALKKASGIQKRDLIRNERQSFSASARQRFEKATDNEASADISKTGKKSADKLETLESKEESPKVQKKNKSSDTGVNIINMLAQLKIEGFDELADLLESMPEDANIDIDAVLEKFTEALEALMPGNSEVSDKKADKLAGLIEWLSEHTKSLEAKVPGNAVKFEQLREKIADMIKDIQGIENEGFDLIGKRIAEVIKELLQNSDKKQESDPVKVEAMLSRSLTPKDPEETVKKKTAFSGSENVDAQEENEAFTVKNDSRAKSIRQAEDDCRTAKEDTGIKSGNSDNSAKYSDNLSQLKSDAQSGIASNEASPQKAVNELFEAEFKAETGRQTELNPERIINQVISKSKVIIDGEKSEMVVSLKPDNLGRLSLKVVTENGLVNAEIIAENQQVKQALEANMQQLKQSFEEKGMLVENFSVSVRQDGENNQGARSFKHKSFTADPVSVDVARGTSVYGGSFSDASLIDPYFPEGATINLTA